MKRKKLRDYNLNKINKALYYDLQLNELWKDKKHSLEQLLIKQSNNRLPCKIEIPMLWIPVIERLIKNLVKIDPCIHFLQIKERSGQLKMYTKSTKTFCKDLIQQQITGAVLAIDTITLIQLELFQKVTHVKN